MPAFTALLGLAAIKDALTYWRSNHSNGAEEFWQQSFSERVYVLKQVFPYPVVLFRTKAYVGGKQIDNKGGKEVDFLIGIETTDAAILVEIKTPLTPLLGPEYRDGVYPLSRDLSGALSQILNYRQSLVRRFDSITSEASRRLTLGEPRCIVIAGNSQQLASPIMKENFELQRERLNGVTVLTFDELFLRLEHLVRLLEEPF